MSPTSLPSTETARAPQRSVPLLIAAGVLVIVVVAAVLLVGVERPPEVELLGSEPALRVPGSMAWLDDVGGENCLRTVDPEAQVREVTCDLDGQVVGWTDAGIVVREWSRGGDLLTVVDPASGSRETLLPGGIDGEAGGIDGEAGGIDGEAGGIDGEAGDVYPRTQRDDGQLTVRLEGGDLETRRDEVLWQVGAPSSYEVVTAVPAPDGSVVALGDNAGRLLVVPADGSTAPRLWLDGAPRYAEYVWEGSHLPAMDVPLR